MKKVLFSIALVIGLFCSCENASDVKADINQLKSERSSLQVQYKNLSDSLVATRAEKDSLNKQIAELNIYKSGRVPKYVLKLRLRQSHFSLDLTQHVKDSMNAIDFELPVDKDFYNSVSVGTEIVDQFRTGSLIMYGSFGNWKMTVTGKEMH